MTEKSITSVYRECDRCHTSTHLQEDGEGTFERWVRMHTQRNDGGSFLVGENAPGGYKTDLCPDCATDLLRYFRQK